MSQATVSRHRALDLCIASSCGGTAFLLSRSSRHGHRKVPQQDESYTEPSSRSRELIFGATPVGARRADRFILAEAAARIDDGGARCAVRFWWRTEAFSLHIDDERSEYCLMRSAATRSVLSRKRALNAQPYRRPFWSQQERC